MAPHRTKTNNSHPILQTDQNLLQKIFFHTQVSDLENCRCVSKHWNRTCNSDGLWLEKYIYLAGIDYPKKHWNGNWRHAFFNRFGRQHKLSILWANYKATQDMKYLKQFISFAEATSASLSPLDDQQKLSDSLLFIDNLNIQLAMYQADSSYHAWHHLLTANCTLYSRNSLGSVRLGVELGSNNDPDAHKLSFKAVALFEGSTKAEHICQITKQPKSKNIPEGLVAIEYRDHSEMLAPFEDVCKRVLEAANIPNMTSKQFIQLIGDHMTNILSKVSEEYYSDDYEGDEDDEEDDAFFPTKELPSIEKLLLEQEHATSDPAELYSTLAKLARGEQCMREAKTLATELQLKPVVAKLLEKTRIISFRSRYGKLQSSKYGGNHWPEYLMSCASESRFTFSISPHQSIDLKATMNRNAENYDDFEEDVVLWLQVDKPYKEIGSQEGLPKAKFEFTENNALQIADKLKVPGLTSVDFLVYMLLCSGNFRNMQVNKGKKAEWWQNKSLKGITLRHTMPESTQLLELKQDARNIMTEIMWDGNHPPSFKLWQESEEASEGDDSEDSEEDSEDESEDDSDDGSEDCSDSDSGSDQCSEKGKPKAAPSKQTKVPPKAAAAKAPAKAAKAPAKVAAPAKKALPETAYDFRETPARPKEPSAKAAKAPRATETKEVPVKAAKPPAKVAAPKKAEPKKALPAKPKAKK